MYFRMSELADESRLWILDAILLSEHLPFRCRLCNIGRDYYYYTNHYTNQGKSTRWIWADFESQYNSRESLKKREEKENSRELREKFLKSQNTKNVLFPPTGLVFIHFRPSLGVSSLKFK